MKNENDKVDHLQNQIREIEMRQKKLTSQIKQISKRHECILRCLADIGAFHNGHTAL